jgi:hypothetical protein
MAKPKAGWRDPSYRYRAYLAEAVVQHMLTTTGRMMGWASHEDLLEFHKDFTASWTNPAPLVKGTGSASSRYVNRPTLSAKAREMLSPDPAALARAEQNYAELDGHYIKMLARDRNVLAYSHELAHSVFPGNRGDGHTPAWMGTFVDLLGRIQPEAAKLLQLRCYEARLTIGVSAAPRKSKRVAAKR